MNESVAEHGPNIKIKKIIQEIAPKAHSMVSSEHLESLHQELIHHNN